MGLFADVTYYALFGRSIIHGGVLERDVLVYFRPPTMGLILAGVHWLFGWKMPAIRLTDLVFVFGVVWLLVRWLPRECPRVWRIWTAVIILGFYLSTTEWCHCQPDTWMLLPALVALSLRWRQIVALATPNTSLPRVGWCALGEGLCWGTACLFKPYVVIPGLFCWLLTVGVIWRTSPQSIKGLLLDALGLFVGGLLIGGLWVAWLWLDGGWSYFWEDFRLWAAGYDSMGPTWHRRIEYLFFHQIPWSLIHVAALPVACRAIIRALAKRYKSTGEEAVPNSSREALLACFYLGWLFQANFLQNQFDYHLTPTIFLALTLIAGQLGFKIEARQAGADRWLRLRSPAAWVLFLGYLGFAIGRSPLLDAKRLAYWPACWRHGSFVLRDALALDMMPYDSFYNITPVDWVDLHAVAEFLRSQGVKDGELTCYGDINTVHLYLELDVSPSVRYPFLDNAIAYYPQNRELIRRQLNASSQRFVVTDGGLETREVSDPWSKARLVLCGNLPPNLLKTFPWTEPIVFRAGPYLVHEVVHRHAVPPLWASE